MAFMLTRARPTQRKKTRMSDPIDVNALLTGAVSEGLLNAASLNILNAVDDIGARIQAGLGTPADAITASEVILISMCVDDSGSMVGASAQAALLGHNGVIQALLDSKQKNGILIATRLLNGTIIAPYTPLDQAVPLTTSNYVCRGSTPLYDETLLMLGTVLAKAQEFSENGVPVRTVSLIVSDGSDTISRHGSKHVQPVVKDLLRSENHIVAAMGIGQGASDETRFRVIFEEMGIRPEWVLTSSSKASEIRKAFAVFSQSAVRASQNAANFSQTALGGFGQP